MVNNGATPSGSTLAPSNVVSGRTSNSENTTDVTGTTQHAIVSQGSNEPTFAGEAVRRIEPIIEPFRGGRLKKSQAIYQISRILAGEPAGSEQLKTDALEQYASTLDRIESLADSANEHGTRVAGPMHEKQVGNSGKRYRGLTELDRGDADEPQENNVNDFLARLSKGLEPGVEQGEPGDGSGDESEQEPDDEPGERGRSNKKQRNSSHRCLGSVQNNVSEEQI